MKKGLVLFFVVILLAGCTKKETQQKETNKADSVIASYVGSFSKQSGAMGVYSGTQLINLYEDGTARIYNGFYGSVAGTKKELYLGTYEKEAYEKCVITITYQAAEEEKRFSANLNDGSFRAQVHLITTMPDDGREEEKGLTFYPIPPTELPTESAYVYSGSNQNGDCYTASYLELSETSDCILKMNTDGNLTTESGTYEVKAGSLEEEAKLIITIGETQWEIPYDNTEYIQTEFSNENNHALRVNLTALKAK